ncbi:MAG TPA: EAL domain-containing protein [Thermoanaerobaculia bacterium]|nr:EAL domain-containing protein [Thermoanaerobaculia bacterium]
MLMRIDADSLLAGDGLRVVFQPIFDVTGDSQSTWGLEALTRGPADTNFASAAVLFDYVRLKHEEARIDRRCLSAALSEARRFPDDVVISLNVHAATLERDREVTSWLAGEVSRHRIPMSRLMFELVEQSQYWNAPAVRGAIADLRHAGARIALDDVGCGRCNYQMIVDLQPDVLKLDRYLVHGCARDRHRAAVLRSIQQLASDVGASVVAEGVETDEDLQAIRDLGLRLVQGFALARPAPAQAFIDSSMPSAWMSTAEGATHVS